jgi:hypothetical protein
MGNLNVSPSFMTLISARESAENRYHHSDYQYSDHTELHGDTGVAVTITE